MPLHLDATDRRDDAVPVGDLLPIPRSSFPPRRVWNFITDRTRHVRNGDHERGSTTAEVVVVLPVLIMLLLFVLYLGRLGQTGARVHHAADQAARSASMVSDGRMAGAARSAAASDLARNGTICTGLSVSTFVSGSRRTGRAVTVSVRCIVSRADLSKLMPGAQTVTARSTEVIDVHRAGEGEP